MNTDTVEQRRKREWKIYLTIMGVFFLVIVGLWFRLQSVRSKAFQEASERIAAPVKVMPVVAQNAWKNVSFLARVEGGQTVNVRSDVGGWVEEKKVLRGQEVKKGDVLIVLKDRRKELSLKEAESRLKSAKAKLEEMIRKLNQSIELYEKGIVSKDTIESLKNESKSLKAEVGALEAAYSRSKWDFDRMSVPAPINGLVVEVTPDIGQEVLPGEIVVTMVNVSNQRLVAGVDVRWARIIKPGLEVEVLTRSYGRNKVYKARIAGVSPNVDMKSGTYGVEAVIIGENNDDLWPGEVVTMNVPIMELQGVVKVPRKAVLSDEKELFVFAYLDDKALKVPVDVTWLNASEGVIAASQIPQGAQLIIEGHAGLIDGESVRVID